MALNTRRLYKFYFIMPHQLHFYFNIPTHTGMSKVPNYYNTEQTLFIRNLQKATYNVLKSKLPKSRLPGSINLI